METIKIGGREITVNELSVMDATECDMKMLLSVEPIINAYQEWGESTYEMTIAHPELFVKLMACSTGQKKKFIRSLKASDFDTLAFVFLSVNAEFFIQRLKLIQMSQ